eukprot:CAMPEP_0197443630 /NCGR_PEP_ID=MMETSP1175-20131217/9324_1 /TAXON_ID=1003142 /ORGANISM="Triceratium dubium, Strain CCMP147" /LENGTH=910 /DNA_ID=CAMNT_0042974293 /DNA_START=162 /DNA_END=2894 /DNA_ORIENTATION=+
MTGDEKKDEEAASSEPTPQKAASEPAPQEAEKAAPSEPKSAASKEGNASSEPWPLRNIKEPHDHDVLYGRGGGTNHHIGNKRYRKMVEDRKVDYVNSKRIDKPLVALNIIRKWRDQDPPGRFLKLDEKSGLWHDVGDKKAREKTSQALREKAPELRKQQEVDKLKKDGKLGSDEELEESKGKDKEKKPTGRVKKTAFNVPDGEPKKRDSKNLKHLMLARDHSLGRDYLKPDERVDLDGFSWDEPVGEIYGKRGGSNGQRQDRASFPPTSAGEGWGSGRFSNIEPISSTMPPPPPGPYASRSGGGPGDFKSVTSASETRVSRDHSLSMNPLPGAAVDGPGRNPFPHENKSVSGGGLDEAWVRGPTHIPSQPYGFPPSQRQTSQSRFFSKEGSSAFSRTSSNQGENRSRRSSPSAEDSHPRSRSSSGRSVEHNHGPYHRGGDIPRRQSEDYRHVNSVAGEDPYDIRRSRSGDSDDYTRGSSYPPPDMGAPYSPSDGRTYSSESWSSHARPYSAALREGSGEYAPPPQLPSHMPQPHDHHRHNAPPHGSYRHPLRRESSDRMSTDEGKSSATPATGLKEKDGNGNDMAEPNFRRKLSGGRVAPRTTQPLESKRRVTRPQPVKRDTSHQCENDETKSKVKRTFVQNEYSLGDSSGANSESVEKFSGAIFEEDRIKELETTFQKSHINSSVNSSVSSTRPSAVSANSRLSTADAIGMAFSDDAILRESGAEKATEKDAKPKAVSSKNRLTTVEAIGMAFEDKLPEDTGATENREKRGATSLPVEKKPGALTPKNRLSTEDAVGMLFSRPLSLSEDQRLTSLGDPLEGDDLLIDAVETNETRDVGAAPARQPTGKPGHMSAQQRVTTVDALLMEIEEEVDALRRPDTFTTDKRKGTITAVADGVDDDLAKAWLGSN